MSRLDWITRGDRSHPNLIALDELQLTYRDWEDDVAKAEEYHVNLPMEFQDKLFEIKEKQRISDGDRRHPRLVMLDSLYLTYPGWEVDFNKAQDYHLSLPDLFRGKIAGMKEKQKMFENDRSHPNLQALDSLNLTYPGSEEDVGEAIEIHTSKPFLFEEKLHEIKERQKMHDNNRTHPRLVMLDSLHLNYTGWQKDKEKAEEFHLRFPELFLGKLAGMKEKQKMFENDRSHPNLLKLDSLALTYPGWRHDFTKAEEAHTHMPLEFDSRLFEIIEKQKIFINDRSHARLVALDSCTFTYPNWQRDFSKAQEYHTKYPELFYGKLEGMKEKQRIFGFTSSNAEQADRNNSWEHITEIYEDNYQPCGAISREDNTNEHDALACSETPPPPTTNTSETLGDCIVCLRATKTHAFVPCGHLCICSQCVPMMMVKKKCPICRQKVSQVIKVFFS